MSDEDQYQPDLMQAFLGRMPAEAQDEFLTTAAALATNLCLVLFGKGYGVRYENLSLVEQNQLKDAAYGVLNPDGLTPLAHLAPSTGVCEDVREDSENLFGIVVQELLGTYIDGFKV